MHLQPNLLERDSDGWLPSYVSGMMVYIVDQSKIARVIRSLLVESLNETYWGEVEVEYPNGEVGVVNNSQILRVIGNCSYCGVSILEPNTHGPDKKGFYFKHSKECIFYKG